MKESGIELLTKFNQGWVLTDTQLKDLQNILKTFENPRTHNSYLGRLPDFDKNLIIHGACMYLYSVELVIDARKSK